MQKQEYKFRIKFQKKFLLSYFCLLRNNRSTSLDTRDFTAGIELNVVFRIIRSRNKTKNYFCRKLAVCRESLEPWLNQSLPSDRLLAEAKVIFCLVFTANNSKYYIQLYSRSEVAGIQAINS